MAHSLGANLSITNTTTFFPHPCDPTKFVNCIIDPCHALKLVRNAWFSMRVIYDGDKNKIDYTLKNLLLYKKMKDFTLIIS